MGFSRGSARRTYRILARLREDRRSFFRDPVAALPGTVLAKRVAMLKGRCKGRVTAVTRIDSRNGYALRLSGWAIDQKHNAPVEDIVIVDGTGSVQGLGVPLSQAAGWMWGT